MIRRTVSSAILALALASASAPGIADEAAPTDANLVTALDLSDSIMRHEQWLQFSGLAGARARRFWGRSLRVVVAG